MAYDYAFVGGGLSAGLAVLALLERQPALRIAVIEQSARLGGNHTWCFHAADVPAPARSFVEPLIAHRWSGYRVRFPARQRRVDSAYACVTSERFGELVEGRLGSSAGCALVLGRQVVDLSAGQVALDDGSVLSASHVVDARGPAWAPAAQGTGFQKFLGLELAVDPQEQLREPVLMDACLPQHDGFRFMYVLPFAPDRVLIEETFFADGPALDEVASERAILAYAASSGLRVQRVLRRERGVLPMPWSAAPPQLDDGPIRAGFRGGYFHPVTGYSFPLAVRFALALAHSHPAPLSADSPLRALASSHERQLGLLLALTRMMFTWFAPEQRFHVLEHFYRLPEPLIERFYAAELGTLDRARLFWGAPPRGLSLRRAFALHPERTP